MFDQNLSDTWDYRGRLPIDVVGGGTTGSSLAGGIAILYGRKVIDKYKCECPCEDTTYPHRTQIYQYLRTVYKADKLMVEGIPGTWPPLNLTELITAWIIEEITTIVGHFPDEYDARWVQARIAEGIPTGTEGDLIYDNGIPEKECAQ